MSDRVSQLLRFGTVGFAVAVVYITLYTVLFHAGVTPFTANLIAFLTAVVVQYVGQTCWTFRRPLWDGPQSVRFFTTIGLGVVYSTIVASQIGPALELRPWIAAGIVAVTLPFINYILFRLWVYAPASLQEEGAMTHVYNDTFFDYIDAGARASASALIAHLQPLLRAESVVDFGSGRGAWLAEWQKAGVTDVCGLDGDYVDRSQLAIPAEKFRAVDLTQPQQLGRRFDLAQSLEVGEHLPTDASETLVASMTAHADQVLFSAAVKGQGGEFHINEQPLSFWQELFARHGYRAFDCVRPALADNRSVEPWYRYNSILYVKDDRVSDLPKEVAATRVEGAVAEVGDLPWRLRRLVVSALPRGMVTSIAKRRAALVARRAAAN